jgi:hypothetical protein
VADSVALRKRRSRKHRAGDHSLCLPVRCKALVEVPILPPPVDESAEVREVELGPTGARLWRELTAAGEPDPLQRVLLLEACRIADRLETLDRQLHGHDWLRFRHDESGAEVTVHVDRVLAEAREQATALRGIVADLAKTLAKAPKNPKGGGVLADLASRRAARGAHTAG